MKRTSVVALALIADKNGKVIAEARVLSRIFALRTTILRQRKGLSRDEFSKEVGIKKSELIAIENGYKFSDESLRRISKHMKINDQYIAMWAVMRTGASFESAANYVMEVKYPHPDFDGFVFREVPIILFIITLTE